MHSVFEILEQSTDSAGPDLISLADLKLALGITDDSDDAALQAAITHQSRIIAEYCGRRFGLADALETFTFDRNEDLLTRQALTLWLYPVVEIYEVSSAGATADGGYDFDPASGRLWTEGCWSGIIQVTYAGGYDLPEEAPARLQQAVIAAVNEGRTSGTRDPSIREVQHGDTRISYFTSSLATSAPGYLSAPVIDLIKPYRRLHVA
jgi:Phage gp6-like head-tail connector protein